MAFEMISAIKGTQDVKTGDPGGAKNAKQVLERIGGLQTARQMAMACNEVYYEEDRFLAKKGLMKPKKDTPALPKWPKGWTVIGIAGYGHQKQQLGHKKYVGDRIHRLSAALLVSDGKKDRNEVMIVCRGTYNGLDEWATNVNELHAILKVGVKYDVNGVAWGGTDLGHTHAGFMHHTMATFFGHANSQPSLAEVVHGLNPRLIYMTGHSLGGAMAHLGALVLSDFIVRTNEKNTSAKQPLLPPPKVRVLTFAAPRVCTTYFPIPGLNKNHLYGAFGKYDIQGVRIVNTLDPVPNVPGVDRSTGGVEGRWSHPPFMKLHFTSMDKVNPHNMLLYEWILSDSPGRLTRDLGDTILGKH